MIAILGWPTLQQRRTDARLVLIYRVIHGYVEIPCSNYISVRPLLHSDTTAITSSDLLPFCRTDTYRHSFFPAGIRLWNQLPQPIASSTTLDGFKAGLATHSRTLLFLTSFNQHHVNASQCSCTYTQARWYSRGVMHFTRTKKKKDLGCLNFTPFSIGNCFSGF